MSSPRSDRVRRTAPIVVVRQVEGHLRQVRGHTGAVGDAEGRCARTGLDEKAVSVAVVPRLELDRQVASGVSAGHAQGAHGRFRAGIDHAQQFDGREGGPDQLRQPDLGFGGRAETRAPFAGLLQGFDHGGMAVTQDQRTPGPQVVDVFVAVHVVDLRPRAPVHEDRTPPDPSEIAHGAVYPAGHGSQGLVE